MEALYCGVDIGGTKLSAGLMTREGTLVSSRSTEEHAKQNEEGVLDTTCALIRTLCEEAKLTPENLKGVGVGMAGHMRHREGVVITTSNLQGFKNYPLASELEKRIGTKVVLDNDANCQALAEHRYGAGKGYSDLIFITVSTGIGAGLILNGNLYRGQSGTAGELGHTIVDAHSDSRCTCGNRGCFMAHASTLNLHKTVEKKCARHTTSIILNRGDHPLNGKLISDCATQKDPLALEIVDEYADYLGILLYNTFQIFNPPLIILGGGLMNWGDAFFERIVRHFHELSDNMLFDPISIVRASLPADSGIRGAATLLME